MLEIKGKKVLLVCVCVVRLYGMFMGDVILSLSGPFSHFVCCMCEQRPSQYRYHVFLPFILLICYSYWVL